MDPAWLRLAERNIVTTGATGIPPGHCMGLGGPCERPTVLGFHGYPFCWEHFEAYLKAIHEAGRASVDEI